ncbi:hypothetical protein O5O45_19815 [Hahella aquimaris]|uniref:hypothetical protein n=1 Tax=Hahella sp. HNIBRBA332 TaxID=3015983 RepID=UPI00273BE085|nr:hypothetical protein [Hahella sp. HNIBRBA332]WLQ11979.1 hypothetical protein O5O45_19815 [Hahella sp. HNIBRBA332]
MAFDYGSIDLGLKNPFKLEGAVTAGRGAIQVFIALYLLVTAASVVKGDAASGWILMGFGVLVLSMGVIALSSGVYAMLRYFVGRNHPTSLAKNQSKSQASTAEEEKSYVGYDHQQLEEMLMGRKNTTFVEPKGLLARLIHSLVPKLLFMPYPVRNMSQRLFGAWVNTAVVLVAYAFVAFVSLAGFAGEAGELAFPVYTALLMAYLLFTWRAAGKPLDRKAEKQVESLGGGSLAKVIALSFIIPLIVGLALSWAMSQWKITRADVEGWLAQLPDLHAGFYIVGALLIAAVCSVIVLLMLKQRLSSAEPVAEVSELRENWQESVHPKEIFINLDNLVMANRRYKEVPNRVYRELDPKLDEQVDGKGGFRGEMIQEVQPKVRALELGELFKKLRVTALVAGNILFVVATVYTLMLAYALVDLYAFTAQTGVSSLKEIWGTPRFEEWAGLLMSCAHLFLIGFLLKSFARLLSGAAHLFFAEIQFESLLVYFKCEGTFTESKISTGTGIHDSTRSENTLVRCSITPWVIVSRIVSTTFAATGMRNLEHPRHILEMHRDDEQLQEIKHDVVAFLKDRESIAAITSERDLGNASQIHQLNQQTRAIPTQQTLAHDEAAAGYLRQESQRDDSH